MALFKLMTYPHTLFAIEEAYASGETMKSIIESKVLTTIDAAVSFIVTLAVLAFVFGIVKFMGSAGNDKSRSEGRQFMVWSVLAIVCMVGVWGIVKIVKTSIFGS